MKRAFLIFGLLFFGNAICFAQDSGNRIYGNQGYYRNQTRQPATNTGSLHSGNVRYYSVEASVLLNMKPDSFVAVFGLAQEAPTAQASNQKVNAVLDGFAKALTGIGISKNDIYVDFITQNRVYDYKTQTTPQGTNVIETFSGFETKKTIAVRYRSRDWFEKIVTLAADNSIFDLIKVDYIVSDFDSVRARLFEDAANAIKQKQQKYVGTFGVKLSPVGLSTEKYDAFYPSERYQAYQAYETGAASRAYNSQGVQITQRKSSTFYYEPLDGSRFDKVITPVGIEPVVQFILYLRMDYDTQPEKER